jgi:hypothetical protein
METKEQYDKQTQLAKEIFVKKTQDYGVSWSIFRPKSLTDQIFIKAFRIRTLQEKGVQKVDDNVIDDFIGLVNYSIMGLIQLETSHNGLLTKEEAIEKYEHHLEKILKLHHDKNHDYGDIWRQLRISSMTDVILVKLCRIREIENNNGKTVVSEGIASGYQDIVNYAIFCLILISEGKRPLVD